MRQKANEAEKNKMEEDQCHHFWVIEIANGPKSRGECKYCGETKIFHNSLASVAAVNDPKRKVNLLELPKMSKVKLDKGSKS